MCRACAALVGALSGTLRSPSRSNSQVKAFVHEGFEEGKTFLRRYDAKAEYVLRHDEFAECRRAYLSACWGCGTARGTALQVHGTMR